MDTLTKKEVNDLNNTYGIHRVKIDRKRRISIPTEWRGLFRAESWIYILHTGDYLILVPNELYRPDPDHISLKYQIDKTGRVLIGKAQDIFMNHVDTGGEVFMIGKGNHLELYLDQTKAKIALSRAQNAANHFQALLIGKL